MLMWGLATMALLPVPGAMAEAEFAESACSLVLTPQFKAKLPQRFQYAFDELKITQPQPEPGKGPGKPFHISPVTGMVTYDSRLFVPRKSRSVLVPPVNVFFADKKEMIDGDTRIGTRFSFRRNGGYTMIIDIDGEDFLRKIYLQTIAGSYLNIEMEKDGLSCALTALEYRVCRLGLKLDNTKCTAPVVNLLENIRADLTLKAPGVAGRLEVFIATVSAVFSGDDSEEEVKATTRKPDSIKASEAGAKSKKQSK